MARSLLHDLELRFVMTSNPRFGSWRHPSFSPIAVFVLLYAHFTTADILTLFGSDSIGCGRSISLRAATKYDRVALCGYLQLPVLG